MVYHYVVITVDNNGNEVPGTEKYAETVSKMASGQTASDGTGTVKILYEV